MAQHWLMRLAVQPLEQDLLIKAVQDPGLIAFKARENVLVDWELLRSRMSFDAALKKAEAFLPVLNGLMRMRFAAYGEAKLVGVLGRREDGSFLPVSSTTFLVAGKDAVSEAFRYLKEGGDTLGPVYELAKANGAVAEALLYFGRRDEPFFNLYKAFEIIRETAGADLQHLASPKEIDRFTRAANDPEISGVLARHSKRYDACPANPMNEHEAKDFVQGLLLRWIRSLSSSGENPSAPSCGRADEFTSLLVQE